MLRSQANPAKFIGRALLIGQRVDEEDARLLGQAGFQVDLAIDPYAAMMELATRPLVYRALVLSLIHLFPEELSIVPAVRKRYPHLQILASQTEQRPALLSQLKQIGIDGILCDAGMLPGAAPAQLESDQGEALEESAEDESESVNCAASEPVLTAEELRALLDEQPLSAKDQA